MMNFLNFCSVGNIIKKGVEGEIKRSGVNF